MWVLSIVDSDRPAIKIPPTNASTRATARPILALRVFITVLLAPAPARWAGPRRGRRDRPAPGSARVSKRRRALRAPAGRVAGPPAGAREGAHGRGSNRWGRATPRRAHHTAGHRACR